MIETFASALKLSQPRGANRFVPIAAVTPTYSGEHALMTLECITVSADPIGYVIRGLNTARSLFLAISLVASQQLNSFLLLHPPSPCLAPVKNTDIIIDRSIQ